MRRTMGASLDPLFVNNPFILKLYQLATLQFLLWIQSSIWFFVNQVEMQCSDVTAWFRGQTAAVCCTVPLCTCRFDGAYTVCASCVQMVLSNTFYMNS